MRISPSSAIRISTPGIGPADGPVLVVLRLVEADHGRRLGQTVPFEEVQDPRPVEPGRDVQGQGGAAGSESPEGRAEGELEPTARVLGESLDARPDLVVKPRDRVHPGRAGPR